ncbi:hypothetical protein DDB_G0289783 [Dictyostelium discoideum AX4]|uniref:Uncharacterized protein n=1 Tax=Dictyostelium discoideum TaxID=44689 RepID=Q54H70_DICDI|nr:hypothetical protein DDB_G0289783 [Dictyostelium discoideum AX4]EAL62603.1 hypothetical protein DDB_G0289783 [Dictyostelium discoideum AX4]|eukprot:XP_636048.1 hypothetical protein DDB_G0289783 [Dictyostelium discoideum AX4]
MNLLLSLIGFAILFALFLFSVGSNAEENGCTQFIIGSKDYTCMGMSSGCLIPYRTFFGN